MDRRPQSGRAQALFLMLAAAVCGVGLAFASGALDGVIATLRARFTAEAPPIAVEEPQVVQAREPSLLEDTASAPTSAALGLGASLGQELSAFDRNEQAVVAINEGRFDEAIELLTNVVEEDEAGFAYRQNLATALSRRAQARGVDEFELARPDFEAAIFYAPDEQRSDRIRARMDRAETIAREEAEFTLEETLHFTFKFDASRTELREGVDRLQVLLEETYQEYGELFSRRPVEAGEKKIAVVLYGAEGFNNVTGLGDWAGGAFDGTIRVPAEDLRDPRRVARLRDVLRHEVAHAFCQSIGGKTVPSWLNEGIAQWLENPSSRLSGLHVARARLVNARDNGGKELFLLAEIQGSLVSWSDTAEITRAYDQALAFVDYLAEQYGARLLFDLVAECKAEGFRGAEIAFERRLLVDLNVVLQDFNAALR